MHLGFRLAGVLASLLLALPLIVPAAAQQRLLLEYPSIHQPTVGTRGMVVSQNETASQIGARAIREGGNAVDAMVAMAFVMAVSLPPRRQYQRRRLHDAARRQERQDGHHRLQGRRTACRHT